MSLAALHLYLAPGKRNIDQAADDGRCQKHKSPLLGHTQSGKRKGCQIEEQKNQQQWS